MNDRDRLGQLEVLRARLERMPASPGRDWMLTEVRARAVDVETGMPPTPMRALPRDELEAVVAAEQAPRAESISRPASVARPRKTPSRRAARGRSVAPVTIPPLRERSHDDVVDLLGTDGVLNVDEAPSAASDDSRPWSRGLRG